MLKKFLLGCATLACCVAPFFSTQAQNPTFDGGTGEKDTPFLISSRTHLEQLSAAVKNGENFKDSYFILTDNIDMLAQASNFEDTSFTPIGYYNNSSDYSYFQGHLDGKGHVISNLYINSPEQDYIGLFGYVQHGSIKNLGLVNADITGNWNVGGLVGYNTSQISNCYVIGKVFGNTDCIGGLIGYNQGTISNCYAAGTVDGSWNVGGLIGNNVGLVANCYVIGKILGNAESIGGLIGYNQGTISNCYATGTVSGEAYFVGGLIGYNAGNISNCYAACSVSGSNYVGGFIGNNSNRGSVLNCYYDNDLVEGDDYAVGLVTDEMKTQSFVDMLNNQWVNNTWQKNTIGTYPILNPNPTEPEIPWAGAGTEADPYKIENREHLVWLARYTNAGKSQVEEYFEVIADINMTDGLADDADSNFTPIGTSDKPFQGHFDGNNKTISNLYINSPEQDCVGFFGDADNGSISNLGLVNADITGNWSVGGLVGYNTSQISNCYVIAKLLGNDVRIGGLCGDNDGSVSNCYAVCEVSGKANYVGGLIGKNYGTISNCYVIGNLLGNNFIGGLIGLNDGAGTVENCYAASEVSGKNTLGGLIGENGGIFAIVSNCYYDNDKCKIGGIDGTDKTGHAEGRSTSYMKSETFVNDLNKDGDAFKGALNNYPVLKGQTLNTVTLTNGTFDGITPPVGETEVSAAYVPGMTDTIYGISPFEDSEFVQWFGNTEALDSYLNETTTFTMGNTPLSFTAQYKNPRETWYTVTAPQFAHPVYYRPSSTVTVSMPVKAGYDVLWSAKGISLTAEQLNQNPMTFIMPDTHVTLTPSYVEVAPVGPVGPVDPKTKSWIWAHYEKDTPEGITIDCLRLGDGVKSANLYRLGIDGAKDKKVGTFKQGKATYIIDADPNLVLNKEYAYELRVKKDPTAKDSAIFSVKIDTEFSFAGEIVAIGAGSNVLVGDSTLKFDRNPSVKGWYTDTLGKKPKTKKISYKLTEKVSGNVDTVKVYTTASVPMFSSKDFKKRTDSAVKWIVDNQDEIAVSYYAKNVNKALKYKKDYHTNLCDTFIAPQIDTILLDKVVCYVPDSKVLTLHTDSEDYKLIFEGSACGYSTPKAFIEYKDGAKFKQANLKVSAVMEKDTTTKSKFVNKDGVSKFQVTIPAKKWTKKPLTDPTCLVISTGKGMTAIPVIIQK